MEPVEGARLRAFVDARWPGTQTELGVRLGVTRQTLDAWFRARNEPSLTALKRLGEVLGVRRADIIAAMDGEVAPAAPAELRQLRAEMAEMAREAARAAVSGAEPHE